MAVKRVKNNNENVVKEKKTKKAKKTNNNENVVTEKKTKKAKKTNNENKNENSKKINNVVIQPLTETPIEQSLDSEVDETIVANESVEDKIMNCVKNCNIFDDSTDKSRVNDRYKSRYPTEKDYQESFDDIISFRNSLTEKERNEIDVIMYNENNNDGMISAYIAWLFYKENNSNKFPIFVPAKPSSSNTMLNFRLKKHEPNLKGKTLLIVDISFGKANYEYLTRVCKNIIIVDDHKIQTKNNIATFINKFNNVKHFIGDTHSACGYVWKFFFPKKDVPYYIMVIDNKDKKLFLPFIPRLKSQYFTSYLSFRVTNSPYLNKNDPHYFDKVHKLLNVDSNYSSVVGMYFNEIEENIKSQVARNARYTNFQNYRVAVLNYGDPVLYKKVCRQMVTNAEKQGIHVDFALVWAWEYTANSYKIFMSEKHSGTPKYNLPLIAQKLAKINGTSRGGLGKDFVASFYWKRTDKYDIWDLFTKKYI